ncbi:hypothetical protein GCM10010405_43720 [Streptomyces macrosporus]|uniref:Uncharacterized protein n=1 Tax=Streptomyces macrosporus TaxID=44032 RepID=A0ABN3KCI3_9ACTN
MWGAIRRVEEAWGQVTDEEAVQDAGSVPRPVEPVADEGFEAVRATEAKGAFSRLGLLRSVPGRGRP